MHTYGFFDENCILKDLLEAKITPGCLNTPDLASNIIWELAKTTEGKKMVKATYNSQVLQICGSKEPYCDWEEFKRLLKKEFVEENYSEKLGVDDDLNLLIKPKEKNDNFWKILKWVLVGFSILLLVGLILLCCYIVYIVRKLGRLRGDKNK